MSSICSKAASNMWLAFDAMTYEAALVDPHSLVWRRVTSVSWWNESGWEIFHRKKERCRLLPFLVTLRFFYSKQLSWHPADFQVNSLLNVAFGFNLSSHFVARAIPIVSVVIHTRPKLIFRIVSFIFLLFVFIVCLYMPSVHINYIREYIFTS